MMTLGVGRKDARCLSPSHRKACGSFRLDWLGFISALGHGSPDGEIVVWRSFKRSAYLWNDRRGVYARRATGLLAAHAARYKVDR